MNADGPATPSLAVRGLTLRFGGVAALDGVDLEVGRGEIVGLIGPNGAGKTSLLNCLSGVTRPQAGEIRVGGRDLRGLRPHQVAARGVARTFQNLGLVADLDVGANLLLGRHHLSRGGALRALLAPWAAAAEDDRHRRPCRDVAGALGLEAYLHTRAGSLPFGVRKRVELARALVAEPSLLLADEPTAGLSGEEAASVLEVIEARRRDRGLTVLLVDHDMRVVMGAVDRVVVLDFGRVVASGAPAAVQADDRVVAAYLGTAATGGAGGARRGPGAGGGGAP